MMAGRKISTDMKSRALALLEDGWRMEDIATWCIKPQASLLGQPPISKTLRYMYHRLVQVQTGH